MSAPTYIYGYGRTKHILDPGRTPTADQARDRYRAAERGLCGAAGGYPFPEPDRPTCKRCVKLAPIEDEATG